MFGFYKLTWLKASLYHSLITKFYWPAIRMFLDLVIRCLLYDLPNSKWQKNVRYTTYNMIVLTFYNTHTN